MSSVLVAVKFRRDMLIETAGCYSKMSSPDCSS